MRGKHRRQIADCLRRNRLAVLLALAAAGIEAAVFFLYRVPAEALLYSGLLIFVLLAALLGADLFAEKRRSAARARTLAGILTEWNALEAPATLAEADYQEMIRRLGTALAELTERACAERQDMIDYYTAWVHQIKTPIAVMKLNLSADTGEGRALSAELFRIEQYVEMVLSYIRLESDTNDLVIREYALDGLIRETLRKYAPQFILCGLRLSYEPTDRRLVTDKKWFCCVLEQLISNAVKYTPEGTVTLRVSGDTLSVSDTGIGIAPEDLPRIFEKGYTGINGRLDRRSSGLGLYLCKKAADKLALTLSVQSAPGQGSCFSVGLPPDPAGSSR